jgi:hypothetical protein
MSKHFKSDPDNYAKLSVPHDSPEKANEQLALFVEDVSHARQKFGIADVLVVMKDSAIYPDGKQGEFMTYHQMGNQIYGEAMAAYLFGCMQSERREMMSKLLGGKSK